MKDVVTQQDPSDVLQRGKQHAHSGASDLALKDYSWAWRHGLEAMSSFSGVRRSFLLSAMVRLADTYEPARQELTKWIEETKNNLLQDTGCRRDLADYVSLCKYTKQPADVVTMAELLIAQERQVVVGGPVYLLEPLAQAQRWDLLILLIEDASRWFEQRIESIENLEANYHPEGPFKKGSLRTRESVLMRSNDNLATQSAWLMKAMLRAEQFEDALRMSERISRSSRQLAVQSCLLTAQEEQNAEVTNLLRNADSS